MPAVDVFADDVSNYVYIGRQLFKDRPVVDVDSQSGEFACVKAVDAVQQMKALLVLDVGARLLLPPLFDIVGQDTQSVRIEAWKRFSSGMRVQPCVPCAPCWMR